MAVVSVASVAANPISSPFLGRIPSSLGQSQFGQSLQSCVRTCKRTPIHALFWGPRKVAKPPETDLSLGDFSLTGSALEGVSASSAKPQKVSVSVVSSISDVPSDDWDACKLDSTGPEKFNPFLTHGFLSSLEESGCAVKETGWMPRHIVARDERMNVVGVCPLYLKSHSYGEYVFDHSWADAYYGYGLRYYPKLQSCVPFTPVTGQRILLRDTPFKDQVFDIVVSAMKNLTAKLQVSSLHVTFPSESEWHKMKEKGFLQRIGMQYHWKNRNYKNFDEFLMDMKQSKRKNIRQERKKIPAQNLTMKRLRGHEIKASHWDTFYKFYRNTTDNKWGSPYLTRDFFHNLGEKLRDNVLLVVAEEGTELVAGALNLIGGDTLYGRLWGCLSRAYYPSLHFEACYYQAIEAAIELNLDKVEAGAQGEHKIQRGYMPVTTYSCHYIVEEEFRNVIDDFLVREAAQVNIYFPYRVYVDHLLSIEFDTLCIIIRTGHISRQCTSLHHLSHVLPAPSLIKYFTWEEFMILLETSSSLQKTAINKLGTEPTHTSSDPSTVMALFFPLIDPLGQSIPKFMTFKVLNAA